MSSRNINTPGKLGKDTSRLQYETVKYDNSFSILDLSAFSTVQRRFAMALLSQCKDRADNETILMNRDDFIYLGVYKPGTRVTGEHFQKDLLGTLNLCASLHFHEVSVWSGMIPKKGEIIPLFKKILYDFDDNWKVEFCVSEEARPYLNRLFDNFTRFFLKDFQDLPTKYQQDLFRYLFQFRTTGWWKVRREDFVELMSIPKSYREYDIDRRVIRPAIESLVRFFPDLQCKKHMVPARKGQRVGMYEFTWKPVTGKKLESPKS